jgi:HK97 family phage prohead protease
MSIYQYKTDSISATIKDVDGKQGIVSGYFNSFNNVDSDGDIIRPGAFTKTIAENGPGSARPRIKHLMNHDVSQVPGVLQVLKEDGRGLYYESKAGSHTLGQDFIKMVESGIVTEHSIGFKTIKKNQLQDFENYQQNPGKGWFEITEVKLWEGSSLTAWGANEMTPIVGMKGLTANQHLDRMLARCKALEKFCRNTTASDETIELLLIEQKQLTQIIIEMQKDTKPTDGVTLPEPEQINIDDIKQLFKTFSTQLS